MKHSVDMTHYNRKQDMIAAANQYLNQLYNDIEVLNTQKADIEQSLATLRQEIITANQQSFLGAITKQEIKALVDQVASKEDAIYSLNNDITLKTREAEAQQNEINLICSRRDNTFQLIARELLQTFLDKLSPELLDELKQIAMLSVVSHERGGDSVFLSNFATALLKKAMVGHTVNPSSIPDFRDSLAYLNDLINEENAETA